MGKRTILTVFLVFALISALVTPYFGPKLMSPLLIFTDAFERDIFWRMRVPRVCTGFVVGAALALSGMVFQAMFRNPLATPFTLGVASGGSLGAALAIRLGLSFTPLGLSPQAWCAFAGCLLSIILVASLTWRQRGVSTGTMLLAGVAVNFFFVALILFIQYTSDIADAASLMRWLVGGLNIGTFESLSTVVPLIALGAAVVFLFTDELNVLSLGDELAAGRGVNVATAKKILFVSTSLMVGGVVSICGPIGFVGMMVPHLARLMVGADHRYLTIATFLFGGAFLALCDSAARSLYAPAEIPVSVITALLGGPFFLVLLLRRAHQGRL